MKKLTIDQLVPDKQYRLYIEDCCVGLKLIGTFVEKLGDPDDPVLIFDGAKVKIDKLYSHAVQGLKEAFADEEEDHESESAQV